MTLKEEAQALVETYIARQEADDRAQADGAIARMAQTIRQKAALGRTCQLLCVVRGKPSILSHRLLTWAESEGFTITSPASGDGGVSYWIHW